MPDQFFKLDLLFFEHAKIVDASDVAVRLFLASAAYANRHLTDGHIPKRVLRHLVEINWQDPEAPTHEQVAAELVELHLWHEADYRCTQASAERPTCPRGHSGTGWRIHDYLEHNRSRAEVEGQRAYERDRKAKWRAGKQPGQEAGRPRVVPGDTSGQSRDVPMQEVEVEVEKKKELDLLPPDGGSSAPQNGAVVIRSARAAEAAVGVIERLQASVDTGARSWSFSAAVKAEWDQLLDDDGNLSAARDFLVWFKTEMQDGKPVPLDWQMAMQKVKRWRARALYGVEQAVTRVESDGIEFWKYVEAVCAQAQARAEGGS